jgi:hypothetical protein
MPRIAPDGYDVLVLPLNDGPGTHVNYGAAGTGGNWTDYGSPISGAQGLLGDAIYIPGSILISSVRNGAGGANDVTASPNTSLSGWVFMRKYPSVAGEIFNKQYAANSWSPPYLTFGFQMHTTLDGQVDLYITIGGALQTVLRTPAGYILPVGRWSHIGGTWNGTTMKMYINGSLVTSSTPVGVIDFGTFGSRGKWYTGGIPGTSVNAESSIIVQDIRVANIERSQSYFADIYYNGFIP